MLVRRAPRSHRSRARRTSIASIAAATALVVTALAGCASTAKDGSGSYDVERPQDYNEQDVSFLSEMIPRQSQALEYTGILLEADGVPPEVTALADDIGDRLEADLDQLAEWREESGGEELNSGTELDSEGAISDDDLAQLETAGTDASTVFLEQMIESHEGAIWVAEQEAEGGQSFGVVEYAEAFAEQADSEVTAMQEFLAALG